jgi:hypothetical protein
VRGTRQPPARAGARHEEGAVAQEPIGTHIPAPATSEKQQLLVEEHVPFDRHGVVDDWYSYA